MTPGPLALRLRRFLCHILHRLGFRLGAEAGRAHPGTEGELLGHLYWKDLSTRHRHEVGDAPCMRGQECGKDAEWNGVSTFRPCVEDGQRFQSNFQLLGRPESHEDLNVWVSATLTAKDSASSTKFSGPNQLHVLPFLPTRNCGSLVLRRTLRPNDHLRKEAPSDPSVQSAPPFPASSGPSDPDSLS